MQGKLRLWLTIIFPYGLGYFIATLYRSLNAILVQPLCETMHIDNAELGFVTSTFVLTFALVQIPLGILLDRFGARITQASFFILGAFGMLVFGLAPNVIALSIGRALLGVGMAGGLMAALKAVSQWVEREDIPFYNGIILAAGGLGALAATTPAKLFELAYGWRALSFILAAISFCIALLIFFVSRDKPLSNATRSHKGLKQIYSCLFFWRITPLFAVSLGGFIAMQGLWLGPWLQKVVGMSALQSANYLLVIALAMTLGMVSGGFLAKFSKRYHISLTLLVVIGIVFHIVTQAMIILDLFATSTVLWFLYGFFAQIALVNYAILTQHFGVELSGRAATSATILIFLFAFLAQYLFGIVVHYWPQGHAVIAYRVAFSGLVILELLTLLWYMFLGRLAKYKNQSSS